MCLSCRKRRPAARVLPSGNTPAYSLGREILSSGIHSPPPRTRRSATPCTRFLHRCGFAGHPGDANACPGYRRLEKRSHSASASGAHTAAKYSPLQHMGIAGGLTALRLYEERPADRATDRGPTLAGRPGVSPGLRLRTGIKVTWNCNGLSPRFSSLLCKLPETLPYTQSLS